METACFSETLVYTSLHGVTTHKSNIDNLISSSYSFPNNLTLTYPYHTLAYSEKLGLVNGYFFGPSVYVITLQTDDFNVFVSFVSTQCRVYLRFCRTIFKKCNLNKLLKIIARKFEIGLCSLTTYLQALVLQKYCVVLSTKTFVQISKNFKLTLWSRSSSK
jgi:hypothetical protein